MKKHLNLFLIFGLIIVIITLVNFFVLNKYSTHQNYNNNDYQKLFRFLELKIVTR